jgi:hypothetical protein
MRRLEEGYINEIADDNHLIKEWCSIWLAFERRIKCQYYHIMRENDSVINLCFSLSVSLSVSQ